jgi:succinyl-CoA synthetase beta subunit
MNLHEYQSKKILASYGVPVPDGRVASSPQEAVAAAQALGGAAWVVKAQVHAGGRGKAGGIKLVRDLEAVGSAAASMLGQRLVTAQTGATGLPIERVYVEAASDIERELYLSLTLNRERARIALVASAAGGMDIEEVAKKSPATDSIGHRRIRLRACSPSSASSSDSGSDCPHRSSKRSNPFCWPSTGSTWIATPV